MARQSTRNLGRVDFGAVHGFHSLADKIIDIVYSRHVCVLVVQSNVAGIFRVAFRSRIKRNQPKTPNIEVVSLIRLT